MPNPGQYRLIARVSGDDQITTFRARRDENTPVLVHQLTPGVDHGEVLRLAMAYMMRQPAASGGRILDYFENNGVTHLVTADDTQCLSLKEWLKWEADQAAAQTAPVPPREEPAGMTRILRVPEPAAPPPPAAEPEAPKTVILQAPVLQPPGEYTRVIQNPAREEAPNLPISNGGPGSLFSSPAIPMPQAPPPAPSGGFRIIPFLLSVLVVAALFLLAVVLIGQQSH